MMSYEKQRLKKKRRRIAYAISIVPISIIFVLFVISLPVVVVEASTSPISTSNDAQTLRALGMSESEIEALLGTSSTATSNNNNDSDGGSMKSRNRNILDDSVIKNDVEDDEYDLYDSEEDYDLYDSIDSYDEGKVEEEVGDEEFGNDFFINDSDDDEILEDVDQDTFEDLQKSANDEVLLDGDQNIFEDVQSAEVDTDIFGNINEDNEYDNDDIITLENSGDSFENDNDDWWKDPFSKFDDQEYDNQEEEDLFIREDTEDDENIDAGLADNNFEEEVDFFLEEDEEEVERGKDATVNDKEEIDNEVLIFDQNESDEYENEAEDEDLMDLSDVEKGSEDLNKIDNEAATMTDEDNLSPADIVDELFSEYDKQETKKADDAISPYVDFDDNLYDEYDSDFDKEEKIEHEIEVKVEKDEDEIEIGVSEEEGGKIEGKEEVKVEVGRELKKELEKDAPSLVDEEEEKVGIIDKVIENDTVETPKVETPKVETPKVETPKVDDIIRTSTSTIVQERPKKRKRKRSNDKTKSGSATQRMEKKERTSTMVKTSTLKKKKMDTQTPVKPQEDLVQIESNIYETPKENETLLTLPEKKEESERIDQSSNTNQLPNEPKSLPSSLLELEQEQESKDKNPTASTGIPLALIPKLGLTLIQSPLTVQVFAGLTVANVAYHRFGGVFKKNKHEDTVEEVLHHDPQNDDSLYDGEDLGESGGEYDLVPDIGFGRPKPVQRRASSQLLEEDEMPYLDDDNKGRKGRKGRKQVQKTTPQETTQMSEKRSFWRGREGKANSEDSSRSVFKQQNKAVSVAPREVARNRFGWRNNMKEEMEAQLNEIESLREKSAVAETERDKLENDYDAVLQRLREAQKQLIEVSRTNNFLKNQLRDNKRVLERAVSAERQKTNNELARVRDQMVAVLERERRIMRAQLLKSSEEVRSMIANKELLDDYKYDYDYDPKEL